MVSDERRARPAERGFLEVGADTVIRLSEVVAVVDRQVLASAATREFLGFCRRKGQTIDLTEAQEIKSAVICRQRVFLSRFSSATLRRRIQSGALR